MAEGDGTDSLLPSMGEGEISTDRRYNHQLCLVAPGHQMGGHMKKNPTAERYKQRVFEITARYAQKSEELKALFDEVQRNARLLLDDDWKLNVAELLKMLWEVGDELRNLTPPKRLKGVHRDLLRGIRHYQIGFNLLAGGIVAANEGKFEEANSKIERSGKEMLTGGQIVQRARRKIFER